MAGKRLDISDQLHLPGARRRAANPAGKRDHQTAVPALIGPDLQQLRRHHPVKPGPVEPVVGMVHLAGHRRHQRDGVSLALGQRCDGLGQRRHSRPASSFLADRF